MKKKSHGFTQEKHKKHLTEFISTNDVFFKFLSKIEMEENFFNQINDINFF